jgi:hypothetical protein
MDWEDFLHVRLCFLFSSLEISEAWDVSLCEKGIQQQNDDVTKSRFRRPNITKVNNY